MKRKVGIAELKAHLSEYLRIVRRGGSVVVLDRETPIARIVPMEADVPRLEARPPLEPGPPFAGLDLPPVRDLGVDVVEILREERQKDR